MRPDPDSGPESYAECFISENLVRNYINEKKLKLSPEAQRDIQFWKNREVGNKKKGNISIEIRKGSTDLSYLDMDGLAYLADRATNDKEVGLSRDADQFKPIRDALAHTALLTDQAKKKLTTVRENITARVKSLLS